MGCVFQGREKGSLCSSENLGLLLISPEITCQWTHSE